MARQGTRRRGGDTGGPCASCAAWSGTCNGTHGLLRALARAGTRPAVPNISGCEKLTDAWGAAGGVQRPAPHDKSLRCVSHGPACTHFHSVSGPHRLQEDG